jgi:hypothetical protein
VWDISSRRQHESSIDVFSELLYIHKLCLPGTRARPPGICGSMESLSKRPPRSLPTPAPWSGKTSSTRTTKYDSSDWDSRSGAEL